MIVDLLDLRFRKLSLWTCFSAVSCQRGYVGSSWSSGPKRSSPSCSRVSSLEFIQNYLCHGDEFGSFSCAHSIAISQKGDCYGYMWIKQKYLYRRRTLLNLNQENVFCYLNASVCFTAVSFSSFLNVRNQDLFPVSTWLQNDRPFERSRVRKSQSDATTWIESKWHDRKFARHRGCLFFLHWLSQAGHLANWNGTLKRPVCGRASWRLFSPTRSPKL